MIANFIVLETYNWRMMMQETRTSKQKTLEQFYGDNSENKLKIFEFSSNFRKLENKRNENTKNVDIIGRQKFP